MDIRSFRVKVILVVFDGFFLMCDLGGVNIYVETKGFAYAIRIQEDSEVFKFDCRGNSLHKFDVTLLKFFFSTVP